MTDKTVNIRTTAQKYIEKNLWQKAIVELKKLVCLDEDDISSRLKIAEIYEKVGDKKSAIENYITVANYYANKGLLTKVNEIQKKIYPEIATNSATDHYQTTTSDSSPLEETLTSINVMSRDAANETDEILKLFYTIPLFSNLKQSDLKKIKEIFHERLVPQESMIIQEGNNDDSMFIIKEGVLKVTVKTSEKKDRYLTKLTRGDFFGELSLLTGKPRSATISTMTNSILLELRKNDFDAIAKEHSSIKNILLNYCNSRESVNLLTKSEIPESRKFGRLRANLPIMYNTLTEEGRKVSPGEQYALLVNISLGGLCIEVDGRNLERLSPGKMISLKMDLPELNDISLDILGQILWTEHAVDENIVGFKYYIGIEFDQFKTENLMALEILISSLKF